MHSGDGGRNAFLNVGYQQDFLKNAPGLQVITTSNPNYHWSGCLDSTFKLSRMKTDWNTYFTQLQDVEISDAHWDREDLSALTHLTTFDLIATNLHHSNNLTNNPIIPIPSYVIDNVINQIASGSGRVNSNGVIYILPGGTSRTSASDAALSLLKSKGWQIYIEGVLQ
jgi:hypothetical protein